MKTAADSPIGGEVNLLVIARGYQPEPGWVCTNFIAVDTEEPEISTWSQCGESAVRPLDVREALLRLAGQQERPVEVVEQSDALMSLSGFGCLLRYRSDLNIENSSRYSLV